MFSSQDFTFSAELNCAVDGEETELRTGNPLLLRPHGKWEQRCVLFSSSVLSRQSTSLLEMSEHTILHVCRGFCSAQAM